MRRIFLHDQGTAQEQEDGVINTIGIIGVLDGVSKPYGPTEPPLIIDSMPSGVWVTRTIELALSGMTFNGTKPELLRILAEINTSLGNSLRAKCGSLPSGLRPGVTFGIACVDDSFVQVAQVADSFVFIRKKNGGLVYSPYAMRAFEEKDQKLASQAMKEAAFRLFGHEPASIPEKRRTELRKEFWKIYLAPWIKLRSKAINCIDSPMGYGLMNGETGMLSFVWTHAFNRRNVELVLCLTDGMIPKSLLKKRNDEEIAKGIMSAYERGGLKEILNRVRREEAKAASSNYIDQGEATGYALEF